MIDGAEAGEAKERVGLLECVLGKISALSFGRDARGASLDILPHHSRTAACAMRACIVLSGICCLCHDVLVIPRCYPLKLFGLLVDSRLEEEIRA